MIELAADLPSFTKNYLVAYRSQAKTLSFSRYMVKKKQSLIGAPWIIIHDGNKKHEPAS